MRIVPLLLGASLALAASLPAQRADSLRVGVQVRVDRWQPTREIYRGTYQTRDSLSFVIAREDDLLERLSIPVRDIGAVEMLVGRRSAGEGFKQGAGRGALVGIGAGAVLMTLAVIADAREDGDVFISAKAVAGVFSVLLTGVTTLIGGAIGAAHQDTWMQVPFRP
jgi:hypothetical protein